MSIEKELHQKLKNIFGLKKTTFSAPDEDSIEQEVLFVSVQKPRSGSISKGEERHCFEGTAFVYAPNDKIPAGFFLRKIYQAKSADTKDLFFNDIDERVPVFQNLIRTSFSFVYFFTGQYDPDNGTINELEFIEGEEP